MDSKTLCLGVLMLDDASGYEIKKHFEEGPFAYFHAAGFGSIYPALNALNEEGLVTCTAFAQDGKPDKKVYAITEPGRRAFRRALHKSPAPDVYRSETVFMLFFADLLDDEHLRRVFEDHAEEYRNRIERMSEKDLSECTAGQRFVHGCGLAVYKTVVDHMESHRDMLFGADEAAAEAAE